MIKSRLFRRLDWLRNSERRFPCCGISSILGCWQSRFSSPCPRRGGGAGLLKIIVAAGIAGFGFQSRRRKSCSGAVVPVQAAARLDRLLPGLQSDLEEQLPANKYPSWDGDVARQRSRIQIPLGAVTVCCTGRDHSERTRFARPVCMRTWYLVQYECICWIRRKRSQLAAAHLSSSSMTWPPLGEEKRGEARRRRPRIPPLCLDRDQAILAPASASSQGR